jgi:uncharacterized membrane protein YccC
MKFLFAFIWRAARTATALGLASAVAWVANDPRWVWLAPIISAVAKAVRDKYGLQNIPL